MNKLSILTLIKENITDFAFERNKLLKSAKSEWVLFLDSDETISPKLQKEIIQLTNNSVKSVNGFYINRENYFLGQFVGTDKILRLGKKDSGRWTRRVHETWEVRGKIGEVKNPIVHNTAKSLSDYIKKINFYSGLHAIANKEEGKTSSLLKIILYPGLKFIQSVFMGRGMVFSILQAFHSFLSWGKLWISQND